MNETIRNAKAIIAKEFKEEAFKNRGSFTNVVGDALTQLEITIQKQLKRLEDGESIESIVAKEEIE